MSFHPNKIPLAVIVALMFLVPLGIFPWLGLPVYFVSLLFSVSLYVVLATSWNIIGGYAGYLSRRGEALPGGLASQLHQSYGHALLGDE